MSSYANPMDTANWVAAWAGPLARNPAPSQPVANRTVQMRIPVSIGGNGLRIVLTNEYGTTPLRIGAASVATLDQTGQSAPLPVRFGGQREIEIEAGAIALSNSVDIGLSPGQHVLLKLYLPGESAFETVVIVQGPELPAGHPLRVPDPAFDRMQLSSEGDFTEVADLPGAQAGTHLPFLSRIDVRADQDATAIAVIGTTYTDGLGVWPDFLSARLNEGAANQNRAIINLSARGGSLSRAHKVAGREAVVSVFDREVLSLPGLTHVIVSEARQDIATAGARSLKADGSAPNPADAHGVEAPVTVASLKAAYRQLISRAHARGVKVLAATMPPFRGVPAPGYYSDEKDELREQLNRWILEDGEFDAVIDIDSLMRDPQDFGQYREAFRSPNMFGPNPEGHKAIAEFIDPAAFE